MLRLLQLVIHSPLVDYVLHEVGISMLELKTIKFSNICKYNIVAWARYKEDGLFAITSTLFTRWECLY